MGAGHAQGLHLHGHSLLHRLPPECKIAAAVVFVLLVVLTPREEQWAFGGYALVVLGLAALGRVPLGFLLRRLVIEVPFVAFAVLIPFVAHGERVDVLGLSLSESGLHSAFNILAKGTLGALTSIVLAATTPVRDLLRGLERLGLPRGFVAIATFMLRYSDIVVGELHRMRIARVSRGYEPRSLLQVRALAASIGALFVRAYERGERVHLAMLSRGWTGALPDLGDARAGAGAWSTAAVLPLVGAAVCVTAWMLER
jgi:cobalt/nickel transport system permease protein